MAEPTNADNDTSPNKIFPLIKMYQRKKAENSVLVKIISHLVISNDESSAGANGDICIEFERCVFVLGFLTSQVFLLPYDYSFGGPIDLFELKNSLQLLRVKFEPSNLGIFQYFGPLEIFSKTSGIVLILRQIVEKCVIVFVNVIKKILL